MKRSIACTAALLGLMLAVAGPTFAATKPVVAVGDTPPDDLGRSRDGREVLISAQHGKVVVVTFWASWCGYCRKELPVLAGLQEAAGKDRVEVVAVNYEDDRDVYRALSRQLKDVRLTMTHDESGRIGEAFGVSGIPHLFVIGKNGKVAFQDTGYGEESIQDILDAVNAALARPEGS
jgi:thiol-disulfide isomerase/thioredoxin